jgi:hypothetical protein
MKHAPGWERRLKIELRHTLFFHPHKTSLYRQYDKTGGADVCPMSNQPYGVKR